MAPCGIIAGGTRSCYLASTVVGNAYCGRGTAVAAFRVLHAPLAFPCGALGTPHNCGALSNARVRHLSFSCMWCRRPRWLRPHCQRGLPDEAPAAHPQCGKVVCIPTSLCSLRNHHKYPSDIDRLVFPPLPACLPASIIYGTLRACLPQVGAACTARPACQPLLECSRGRATAPGRSVHLA